MIHCDGKSLTPDKNIAEMTLFNSQTTFGEQQDMSECLDSFFNLMSESLEGESKEDLSRYILQSTSLTNVHLSKTSRGV
jgi:hypothetical protein